MLPLSVFQQSVVLLGAAVGVELEIASTRAGKRPAKGKGATRNVKGPEVKQRPGAPWLGGLLVVLGLAMVGGALSYAYLQVSSYPVQRIAVTGNIVHTQTEQVQNLVQPLVQPGFLRSDLTSIREALEALPWVYSAQVRRKWPDELHINVTEQLPIARWSNEGFLNHEGIVFESAQRGEWSVLPLLQGPEGSAPLLMSRYLRLVDILQPLNLSVAALRLDERGQLEVALAQGMTLLLGSEHFLQRMHRFVAIYRSDLASRLAEIERVDMRYQTGLAVAYREDSQVAGLQ